MATILNIETSTEVCSVNLARNGKLIVEKESSHGLNHSQLLTVFIDSIFQKSGIEPARIDAVAVSKGPGSYTGLRIGVSVAKGLCYALGIPLIAVGTLDVLGKYTVRNIEQYFPDILNNEVLVCPMIDARRMEVYSVLYNFKEEQVEPVSAKVIDHESYSSYLDQHPVFFFGNGAEKCKSLLTHPNALFYGPLKATARFMINFSEEKYNNKQFEEVAYFEPYYLKDFIATTPKKKIIQ